MGEFRVGDRVKCPNGLCKGLTGTISHISGDEVQCEDWSDGKGGFLGKQDLIKLEEDWSGIYI